MNKFNIGDTVKVIPNPSQLSLAAGETFTVTGARTSLPHPEKFWYQGDHNGYGVWEENLEMVVAGEVSPA